MMMMTIATTIKAIYVYDVITRHCGVLSVSPYGTLLRSTLISGCVRTPVVVNLYNHAFGSHKGEYNVDRTEVVSNRIRDAVRAYSLLAKRVCSQKGARRRRS